MSTRRKPKSNVVELIFIFIGALLGIWLAFGTSTTEQLRLNMLVGAIIGAIFWPIARSPEITSRGIAGGIIGALAVGLFELLRVGLQVQQGTAVETLGAMALTSTVRVVVALIAGAIIGIGSVVPSKVLVGAIAGVFVGMIVGGVAAIVLASQGISLSREIFLGLVGLVTLILFSSIRAA